MLVRELRRILDGMPANLEIMVDSPSEEFLLHIDRGAYKSKDDETKEHIMVLKLVPEEND